MSIITFTRKPYDINQSLTLTYKMTVSVSWNPAGRVFHNQEVLTGNIQSPFVFKCAVGTVNTFLRIAGCTMVDNGLQFQYVCQSQTVNGFKSNE